MTRPVFDMAAEINRLQTANEYAFTELTTARAEIERLRTEVRARTVQGFCRAYGIGRSMTYELIRAGQLRTVKAGARTLIDEDSARVWFATLGEPSAHTHTHTHTKGQDSGGRRRTEADG